MKKYDYIKISGLIHCYFQANEDDYDKFIDEITQVVEKFRWRSGVCFEGLNEKDLEDESK